MHLILDAGTDPTIPAGRNSLLHRASAQGYTATAALLRQAIAEPDRPRALHKPRSLIDAAHTIAKARSGTTDEDDDEQQQQQQHRRIRTRGQRKQQVIAVAPAYLTGRVQQDAPLPIVELTPPPPPPQKQGDDDEQLRATVAFVVGLEGDGSEEDKHLPWELFKELLGYLMHAWADKGPAG